MPSILARSVSQRNVTAEETRYQDTGNVFIIGTKSLLKLKSSDLGYQELQDGLYPLSPGTNLDRQVQNSNQVQSWHQVTRSKLHTSTSRRPDSGQIAYYTKKI